MKHILCFGDSNTYGTNPRGGRWQLDVRWTGIIQQLLGTDYRIIEEGCGGRTTVWEDNLESYTCGKTALPIALASHMPLDLVIIALGTNDLKARFSLLPFDIANGAGELAKIVRSFKHGQGFSTSNVLLLSPIHIGENVVQTGCFGMNAQSVENSKRLLPEFERVATVQNCAILDASAFAKPSPIDNLHMEAADHEKLAVAIAKKIRALLE